MPQDRRRRLGPFPQVCVSERLHKHVQALEAAALQYGEAETPEEIGLAHRNLSLAREALYQYGECLEQMSRRIERTVTLHRRTSLYSAFIGTARDINSRISFQPVAQNVTKREAYAAIRAAAGSKPITAIQKFGHYYFAIPGKL